MQDAQHIIFILLQFLFRYDMCRRRKGGRCTKGTAGKNNNFLAPGSYLRFKRNASKLTLVLSYKLTSGT